jgi:hypothetical protein
LGLGLEPDELACERPVSIVSASSLAALATGALALRVPVRLFQPEYPSAAAAPPYLHSPSANRG